MSVIDTELPYTLIDLVFLIMLTGMSAILMCLSVGYFAATMAPVFLAVHGKNLTQSNGIRTWCFCSLAERLFKCLSLNASPRPGSEISIVFSLSRILECTCDYKSVWMRQKFPRPKPHVSRCLSKAILFTILYTTMASIDPWLTGHCPRCNSNDTCCLAHEFSWSCYQTVPC
jgi:hypothetical protein